MDHTTIDSLYRKHGLFVLRCARLILQNEQAAQDARQEVFLRAIRAGSGFREEASPLTWLYRITTNYCFNELRDSARRSELLRLGAASCDTNPASAEDRYTVLRLLEDMPNDIATIAIHYFVDEMRQEEIASLLQVSRRHVRDRLDSFRQMARSEISKGSELPSPTTIRTPSVGRRPRRIKGASSP